MSSGEGPAAYRTLLGNLREHIRAYIAKQLLLPRQEIGELLAANLRALAWMSVAAGLLLLAVMALIVLLVTLLALLPREWLGVLVLALSAGAAGGLVVTAFRVGGWRAAAISILLALAVVAIGVAAFLFLQQLQLAALLVTLVIFAATALAAYTGYRRLQLRGPERSIRSVRETISWVKATLLGQSES